MKKILTSLVLGLVLVSASAFAGQKEKKIFRANYCGMKSMAAQIDAAPKNAILDFDLRFMADAYKMKVEREYVDAFGIVVALEKMELDSRIQQVTLWQSELADGKLSAEDFTTLIKGQIDIDSTPAEANGIACQEGGSVRG